MPKKNYPREEDLKYLIQIFKLFFSCENKIQNISVSLVLHIADHSHINVYLQVSIMCLLTSPPDSRTCVKRSGDKVCCVVSIIFVMKFCK